MIRRLLRPAPAAFRARRATLILLVLAAFMAHTGPAAAFFPSNALTVGGLAGTSHQKMTEQAIKELDAEFFGITRLTKSMEKAMEQIAEADQLVDKDQKTSAKHFDGENFPGGQRWIVDDNRSKIKPALQADDAATARKHLGSALHTIQDFYSHSNWIELGNGGPHPGVGVPGGAIPAAGPGERTCNLCLPPIPGDTCVLCLANLTGSSLTSGYYSGEDRTKPGLHKCSHGGLFDFSTFGVIGGINKDSFTCTFSPHFFQHGAAAAAAKEATKKFIRELRGELSEKELKLLLGVGPNLAMAIDTTGSMGPIIAGVRSAAIGIVNSRLGTDEEPSKYVLSPFNDPFTGPLTVTKDPDVFKAAIGALGASGGGDCPELANTGKFQALSASDERGTLFMFTDASSKDGGLAGAVASLAAEKDIKVIDYTFGSCSPLDPTYISVAEQSGGQVFELFSSEAGRATQLADLLARSNAVDVAHHALDLTSGTPRTLTLPVDSALTRVTFSISGTTGITLTRPDGTTVAAGQPGVTLVSLSRGALYSIATPAPGPWSVRLTGAGRVTLLVNGESTLDMSSFRFVEAGGRPGHEGFFPISGLPVSGEPNQAIAVMSGDFASVGFELRAFDGSLIQTLPETHAPGQEPNEFFFDAVLPETGFRVYAAGADPAGFAFQRLRAAAVRPQPVKVLAPEPVSLPPGRSVDYVFKVKSFGPTRDYRFRAADNRRWVSGVTPSTFSLPSGGTVDVSVRLTIPAGAVLGTAHTLTATVEALTNPDVRNFAVVESNVADDVDTTPPDIQAVSPDPAVLWPPNHKMRAVEVAVTVSDDRDPNPVCQLVSISSDEPEDGTGSGDTAPDWELGPGPLQASLRAERAGDGDGRTYTLVVSCADAAGNTAEASASVVVPHDQGH